MTHPTLYFVVLVVASVFTWRPGNWLLEVVWEWTATAEKVDFGPSPLVRSVGGLERIVYLMSVIGHHYEIISGWLVLKAFFGFMGRDQIVGEAGKGSAEEMLLTRYNGLLLGNALSLIIGVSAGVAANLFISWRLGAVLNWSL